MSQDVSIRVAIEGDEEIQRKIDDLKKSFEDLEKAAKDATQPAQDLADALKDVAQTDAASKVQEADEALKNLDTSASGAQTKIEDFNTAVGDTDTNASAASGSLDTLDASYTNVSTSASDAQTNIANSVDSLEGIDSAGQGASSGLDAVSSSFDSISTSAQDADQNIKQASEGIEGIGTATGEAESAMSGLGSAFEGAGTSANTMNDALGQIGDQMEGVTGGLTSANTGMQQFGQSATQASQSAQGLGSSLGIAVGFFGTAASGAVSLATSINNLHGAQIRVEQMGLRLSKAQDTEAAARAKLNQLYSSGVASAEEIAQAELDVQQAHEGTTIAAERLDKAQTDLSLRFARFATDVLPSVIQTATSTIAAFTQMQQAFPDLGGKISGIASAIAGAFKDLPGTLSSFTNLFRPLEAGLEGATTGMTKTAQAANLLRTAIAGITFTGFLAIVTAISTALVLLATNTGGSRDAMNEYGKAIGKAVPQAKPLLDFFGKAIEGLGQLMGVQSEADKAMIAWATTVAEQSEKAKSALESPFEFLQQFTDQLKETASLKVLDEVFGGAGFGETLALLGQITGALSTAADTSDRFGEVLEPVAQDLRFLGKTVEGVGGEVEARYNKAVAYAHTLTEKFAKTGVQPTVHELTILQHLVAGVGDAINTEYADPIEEAATKGEKLVTVTKDQARTLQEGKDALTAYNEGLTQIITGEESVQVALEQANVGLRESISETQEAVGSWANYENAILEVQQSHADHNLEIDKLNTLLNTAQGRVDTYANAVAAGNEEFLQWNQSTREAAISNQQLEANLQSQADTLGGLPSIMEPTIENYKAFIRAQTEGGDAAKEFEKILIESWSNLTAEAEPLFDDLKEGWRDVFSGTSAQEVQANIQEISSTFTEEMGKLQKELGEVMSAPEFDQAKYQEILSKMDELYRTQISDMAEATSTEFIDPVMAAFDKLPPAVAATLDETERSTLAFQAKLAVTAEQAGQAWATNLKANMGLPDMAQKANEAAQAVLAPFLEQHPEMAQMFQPIFDEMQKMGPSSLTDIHTMLQNFANVPGDIGVVAGGMLTEFETKFADELGPSMKTGTENAMDAMSMTMSTQMDTLMSTLREGFNKLIEGLNKIISGIEQKPEDVPIITANTNPANSQIQGIGASLTSLKEFLARPENQITLSAKQENPLAAQISGAITSAQTLNEQLASTPVTLVGAQTNPLEGQISGAINSVATLNQQLASTPITLVAAQTNPLEGQISGVITSVQTLNEHLQQNTITLVASNENPLAGQINLVSETPRQVNDNLTQNTITMVASNENPLAAQISGVISSVQSLQQWLQQNPISLGTGSAYAGGGGGRPPGFAKGFGPAFITKPTRMLVGEAGPELVSVIPVKNRGRFAPTRYAPTITAQAGAGYQPPGAGPSANQMQNAVQEGAQEGTEQGVQDGMQQAQQQGGYPQAPSNTELFGAGRFTWSPGGMGGGGAQYPQAPSNTEIWGAGRFTWGGGAAGPQLGGGNMRGGAQYPVAPSNTELFGTGTTFTWAGGKAGTTLAQSTSKSFVKEFQTGMKNQSQLINGVPATILSGNQNPAQQAGFQAGQTAGSSFASGFNQAAGSDIVKPGDLFPQSMSSLGPGQGTGVKAYTGKVPASYGPPLGQNINGIPATILPGGPGGLPAELRGLTPGRQPAADFARAQGGMHKWLRRNTMIQAHRGERVDIGRGGDIKSDKMVANLMRMLTKLIRMQGEFEVNFNVDGSKLGHVTSKNIGRYGYGDRPG